MGYELLLLPMLVGDTAACVTALLKGDGVESRQQLEQALYAKRFELLFTSSAAKADTATEATAEDDEDGVLKTDRSAVGVEPSASRPGTSGGPARRQSAEIGPEHRAAVPETPME
eukprot:Skav207037  [mRNA]  locus=scaffold1901:303354:311073:- [translate_table: standard]